MDQALYSEIWRLQLVYKKGKVILLQARCGPKGG